MYITTFYSFKGGVGRTMALVNTAVSLAQRGRRVLVVDFDIEAPGLDTFEALRPTKDAPGVVNFVAEYVHSGRAPNVADYIHDCPDLGEGAGKIWIMPSGKNEDYASTLAQIDWADLYLRRDGYLLFEDLKEQWLQTKQPDYVLVDSRTGHTDASGICTRQLPNSVVILFFPNEQNLRGLTQVVRDIRAEVEGPRQKRISLHFVMSNVPDLDDEDQILRGQIQAFQKQLGFRRDPTIVHRYDSLSLLNQVVFTKDRPRSRLAHEYKQVASDISFLNWNDREGALAYIRRARGPKLWLEDDSISSIDGRLERIEQAHAEDGEILFRLGKLREFELQFELAAQLIDQAIEAGFDQPEAFLTRSQIRDRNGNKDGAVEDAWRVLASQNISPQVMRSVVRHLTRLEEIEPNKFVKSNAVMNLDVAGKRWLAAMFDRSRNELSIAASLWEDIIDSTDLNSNMHEIARHGLGLSYIGLGKFRRAASLFRNNTDDIVELKINEVFNYGMALWGSNLDIDRRVFGQVVALDRQGRGQEEATANYLQCMAISYWAAGELGSAEDFAGQSRQLLTDHRRRSEFSCWRYLLVERETFERDLDEIQFMINGDEPRFPRFIIESRGADIIGLGQLSPEGACDPFRTDRTDIVAER